MSHPAQRKFCRQVRRKYPNQFRRVYVADVGSMDINGNNRYLFRERSWYIGIDVAEGENVDLVGPAHQMLSVALEKINGAILEYYRQRTRGIYCLFDTIISTEALEHDKYLPETLKAMYESLTPGGLLLITCAGDGRKEHGTYDHTPHDSPGTLDYYKNVSNEMFSKELPAHLFSTYHLEQINTDLQFYGIKKM